MVAKRWWAGTECGCKEARARKDVRATIRCKVDEEKCKVGVAHDITSGSGEWRGYNRALTHVRLEYRCCILGINKIK